MSKKNKIQELELSELELLKIECNSQKLDINKLKVEKLKINIEHNFSQKIIKEREAEIISLKNRLLFIELEELKKNTEKRKDEARAFMLELRNKYKLPEKWGFNPESGKIITTEGADE